MIVNIVNITFVVSPVPGLCVQYMVQSRVCTGCRVHHLNMITSYKLGVGRVRSGLSVLTVSGQIISKMIVNAGEAGI